MSEVGLQSIAETEAAEVQESSTMTQTQAWLDEHHPERYEIEGEGYLRCPTCEEWSPCRVRAAFVALDQAISTVRGSVAWLDGNNLTHINEDRFLDSLPGWWDGIDA